MATFSVGTLKIDASQIDTKLVQVLRAAKANMPQFIDRCLVQMGDAAIDFAIPLTRVRTGRLRSSYRMTEVKHSGNKYAIMVYNQASEDGKHSYAVYNEFGTMYMAPRLMLSTAKERIIQEANPIIKTALIRLIRGDIGGGYTFKFN